MSQAFAGNAGSGAVLVYTVPDDHALRLELLTFTLTTDATPGVHSAEVQLYDAALAQITARLWDWNEGGPAMTLYYTYGIGLRPFNCTVTTGMMLPVHLPDTVLTPATRITVRAVDSAGSTLSGDQISAVVLFGTFIDATQSSEASPLDLVGGLLPVTVEG